MVTTSEELQGSRTRRIAVGAALVVSVSAIAFWTLSNERGSPRPTGLLCNDPAALQSWAGFVACQATVIEGDVLRIGPKDGSDRQSITMKVSHWLKPAEGPANTTLDVFRVQVVDAKPGAGGLKVGSHYLLTVPKCPTTSTDAFQPPRIAETRRLVIEALPESITFENNVVPC